VALIWHATRIWRGIILVDKWTHLIFFIIHFSSLFSPFFSFSVTRVEERKKKNEKKTKKKKKRRKKKEKRTRHVHVALSHQHHVGSYLGCVNLGPT
jgi:hypothetical protein